MVDTSVSEFTFLPRGVIISPRNVISVRLFSVLHQITDNNQTDQKNEHKLLVGL